MLWDLAAKGPPDDSGASLSQLDVERLASLHREVMPGSILSALGESVLRRYYGMVDASVSEGLLVHREAGRVIAAAVLSLEADSLLPRLMRRAPASLALACGRSLLTNAGFHAQLASFAASTLRGDAPRFGLPEVTQIFTDPSHRKRGVGRRLLERVERHLVDATAHREYMVRTLARHNQSVLDFYEGLAFERFATLRFCGDEYVCLKRRLD